MGTEGRTITESCLTDEQWNDSQKNEAWFWKVQKEEGNPEQYHRNHYYRNILEDDCTIARDFFAQDFTGKAVLDVGSGPYGILHVLEAESKLAIDPLMDVFREQGYDVESDNVECLCSPGEDFEVYEAEYIVCLNALDHMKDPQAAIKNIVRHLVTGGELLLIIDLRPQDKLDAYHKLAITEEDVLAWTEPYFDIIEGQNIAHGDGTVNKVRQLVLRCKKRF